MKRMLVTVLAMIATFVLGAAPALADPAGISDRAGVFGTRTGEVEAALTAFQTRTTMTGTVATANGIGTQDIRTFATTAGAVLGRDQGEAIVIGIDMKTRKVGVYTTPSAMARIPDAQITRIIDTVMTPAFRTGDYVKGVVDGLAGLADVATGAAPSTGAPATTGAPVTASDTVPAPAVGGATITLDPGAGGLGTYVPGFPGNYPGNFPTVTWPDRSEPSSGIPTVFGIFFGLIALLMVGGIVSAIVASARAKDADTPELRAQLADLVASEPDFTTWSNRRRYEYARRHTAVPLGTWNAIYPQWHVRDSNSHSSSMFGSGSSSSGGFSGGGGSSSSFSDGGSSGSF